MKGDLKAGDFQMPLIKDAKYDAFMQKFMYSFKNIYSENINETNVLFVTGPQKMGKSWYIRYNLRKFQNSPQNPMIFHYDFREQGAINFEMFLFTFERMIINTLVQRNNQNLQSSKKPLISDQGFMDVIFRFYDKSLFEQDLAKCLDKATNNYSMTAGFSVSGADEKRQLRTILEKYRNREYKETPLLDHFTQIAEIVAKGYQNDLFRAKVLIVYDVLMRKEQERKPPHYVHSSQFRNGLDVLQWMFDLINHIAGYTVKFYDEIQGKMDHEQLVKKYRAEKNKYADRINDSDLLGDKFLHCLMVIESIQELVRMQNSDGLAKDYFDTLILRLQNGTDNWHRNHFPVVLESNMSYYFNEDIYNELQLADHEIATVELVGFKGDLYEEQLKDVYNRDQIKAILNRFGRSPYFLSVFTEQYQLLNITDQLKPGKKERNLRLSQNQRYRLNKLYSHPLLGHLLDNGDIDYCILDTLEQMNKYIDRYFVIRTEYAAQEWVRLPIMKALLDLNIVHLHRHYAIMSIEHILYQEVLIEYVYNKKSKMNGYEKLRYSLYRKVQGNKFGTYSSGVPQLDERKFKHEILRRNNRLLQTHPLYFTVPDFN